MDSNRTSLLVFDGFADWEPAHALAELRRSGKRLAPIEFAREIFRQLGIFSAADEDLWFDMFKHGRLPQSAL